LLLVVLGGWLSKAWASDVNTSITIDGSSVVVSLTSSGDRGFVTFSGTAGQYLGLGVSSNSISNLSVSVSSSLASGTVGTGGGEFDFKLPADGTYTITLDPPGSSTGSVTLTLSEDVTTTISVGGDSVVVPITRIGQNGRVYFEGTAEERIGLGLSSVSSSLSGFDATLYKPDGTTLVSDTNIGTAGSEMDAKLPTTGSTYRVVIDPDVPDTGSVTLWLRRGGAAHDGDGAGSGRGRVAERAGDELRLRRRRAAGRADRPEWERDRHPGRRDDQLQLRQGGPSHWDRLLGQHPGRRLRL
jgi:hypothetical protein